MPRQEDIPSSTKENLLTLNEKDIEIRSDEVQEILSHVPNWVIRWGISCIFISILLLLFMSWFIKYPDVIATEVMITTSFPPEKIYAKSSGQFEVILVKDGDSIQQNKVLAVLENSAYYKDVLLLQSIVDTLKINHTVFKFPIQNLPPLILGDITTAFSQFENSYSDYVLNNELTPYKSEDFANRFSVIEAKRRLQNLYNQKELNNKELFFKKKDVERQKNLFEKGVISAKEYEQKQLEFLQAKRNAKTLESSISQVRELITNFQKNVKGTSIKKKQNDSRLLKKAIQSYFLLKKVIKDWEKQFVLKSSIEGKVSFLSYYNQYQTVKTGDFIFTIIPLKNISFIGKIKAPAANSGKIKIGQRVQIKLLNYPSNEFGEINGNVNAISLIPDVKGNYLIDVKLPKKLITTYNKNIEFKQEMKGSAKIITEDLRLIERFFYQLKNIIKH